MNIIFSSIYSLCRGDQRVILAVIVFFVLGLSFFAKKNEGNQVKVIGDKGQWILTVNNQPFYIKGIGVGHVFSEDKKTDFLKLAQEMGANTVRTWGADQATKEYLDQAHSYGLLVDVGFWLNPVYANGQCSYLTDVAYREDVRRQVLDYVKKNRNHPAILAWNIGNETIYWTKDEKERIGFCQFLEELVQEVHKIDPHHPVLYASAYITDAEYILKFVPSLDILGVNVYGAVRQTHAQLVSKQKIPIVFTEFGPPGPWAFPVDMNQRPHELTDKQKADFYEQEGKAVFESKGYNLGGFVFSLGETSQISLTWWNVNAGGTRKLSYVKLRELYTGISDGLLYPFIRNLSLSKEKMIHPGEDIQVTVDVSGEDKDISYAYMASTDIDSELVENPNERIYLRWDAQGNKATVKAPLTPGIYRLYAVIYDSKKNYASTLSRTILVGEVQSAEPQAVQNPYFKNMNGCFILYNMKTSAFEKVIGEDRCREQLPPCSTFKVPLAVMAFDAGILKDENEILKWDGKKDTREVANHDHNVKTWMRDSIVWFSQRLTPQLGAERLKKYLHDFQYGNEDMSAGITQAWLVAPDAKGPALRISAFEQVEFMKGLWTDNLAVSPRAMQLARAITYLETSPKGFRLSGKTGSNSYDNQEEMRLGWFIAHIDNGQQEYIAVTNFSDLVPAADGSYGGVKAREITKKILSDQGLW